MLISVLVCLLVRRVPVRDVMDDPWSGTHCIWHELQTSVKESGTHVTDHGNGRRQHRSSVALVSSFVLHAKPSCRASRLPAVSSATSRAAHHGLARHACYTGHGPYYFCAACLHVGFGPLSIFEFSIQNFEKSSKIDTN
jgi:hypothetical protein